jgi:hypothetical protein
MIKRIKNLTLIYPKPYNFRPKCEYCVVPLVRCSIRQRPPNQRLIEYLNFGSTSTSCELASFNEEALTNENINKWKQAMDEEYQLLFLLQNNTWSSMKVPYKSKSRGCMWVYKMKFNSSGQVIDLRKDHLIRGYSWIEGVDHNIHFFQL